MFTEFMLNDFVARQTPASRFSHFAGSDDDLISLVSANWHNREAGYRPGVVTVSVPPDRFFTGVVKLREGDELTGTYEARRKGETPRKVIGVVADGREKLPARAVDVVLYSGTVLAESEDNNGPATDDNWEVISINARTTLSPEPIHPTVLSANHFGLSGSSDTSMTADEYEAQMRISVPYWSDKATLI
jgi:hypothetical protein